METRTHKIDGYEITYRRLTAREMRVVMTSAHAQVAEIMADAADAGLAASRAKAAEIAIFRAAWPFGAVALDGEPLTADERDSAPWRVVREIGALVMDWSESVDPSCAGRWSRKATPPIETSSPAEDTTKGETTRAGARGPRKARRAPAAARRSRTKEGT